jgi:hypothetical protein
MWISKPLAALSGDERRAWRASQERASAQGLPIPLAQTLSWARAGEALGARAFAVFSPDEGVGGLVHSTVAGLYEATNGPILDWGRPDQAPRQLATFAMAVSRLAPGFRELVFRPRWPEERRAEWMRGLPVEEAAFSRAATLQLPVEASDELQAARSAPRLRRTLEMSRKRGVELRWDVTSVEEFALGLARAGRQKGYYVPPPAFLKALSAPGLDLELRILEARSSGMPGRPCLTRLALCLCAGIGYYLFGYDERDESVSSSLSTAVCAHFEALRLLRTRAIPLYDLNGFTDPDESPSHAYAGVSRFKAQFGGRIVRYHCPEFRVS